MVFTLTGQLNKPVLIYQVQYPDIGLVGSYFSAVYRMP